MQSPTLTAKPQSPPSRLIRCNRIRDRATFDENGVRTGTKKVICGQALLFLEYGKGTIRCTRCPKVNGKIPVVEFELFDSSSY